MEVAQQPALFGEGGSSTYSPVRTPTTRTRTPFAALTLALIITILIAPVSGYHVLAATSAKTALGPPTTVTPTYLTLGYFHRIGAVLRQGQRVEVVFLGSQNDNEAATERWPLVKALAQFGTLSGLGAVEGPGYRAVNSVPTFDFTRARYRNSYVLFDHKDFYGPSAVTTLPKSHARQLQRLSKQELALLRRYGPIGLPPAQGQTPSQVSTPIPSPLVSLGQRLRAGTPPMELIGDYVMNGALVDPGEMSQTSRQKVPGGSGMLSFSQVQKALQQGYRKHYGQYVFDIDAETNVLTSLICHADHMRPAKVCRRQVIREIVRHEK